MLTQIICLSDILGIMSSLSGILFVGGSEVRHYIMHK